MNSDGYAWLPFAAALTITLAGPLINLAWVGAYLDYYKRNFENPSPTLGQLRSGAEWAVDVAASIPNCALTLIGIVLLDLPIAPQLTTVGCIVIVILLFCVTLLVARRQRLTEERRVFRNLYSPLAWVQVFMNVIGLAVAIIR